MEPSESTEDQTPAERPPASDVERPLPCPDHPTAPQTENGCTVEGCTYSVPASS